MKKVGKVPTYDIQMPDTVNFVLDNGVVAHNCAYSELGYITMWLKSNYKLEWWCAELNSCLEKTDAEAKIRSYTALLGEIIIPTSLKNPSNKFEIVGNKISAPLSIIKGLGPASINEIVKNGPFNSIYEFATKVSAIRCNGGHFAALIRARVADCFMDPNIPYAEARLKLLKEYVDIRKCKPLPTDIYSTDPLSIFLSEKAANKCFSKTLSSDPALRRTLIDSWKILVDTGKKAIPFMMGSTPVIGSVKAALAILDKQDEIDVGFIGLYESSEVFKGISKKSGKSWCKLEVHVTDGVETLRCDWWKRDKALRLPIDSIVYVKGKLKKGWRDQPTISITEIQKIGQEE
jgi:DNA polymerase III alpha subunit